VGGSSLFVSSSARFGFRLRGVEPEITPEPSPEEREAILAALREQEPDGAAPAGYGSAWRREGIRESLEDEADSG
jgi:hypothetical protein